MEYDFAGNVNKKIDGKGNATAYTYDGFNRLKKVTNAKGENTEYTYDYNGNMVTQTDGEGNVTTFEYNQLNLIKRRIDDGGRTVLDGEYIYDPSKTVTYTYFPDGKLKTMTDRNGVITGNSYDDFGRLILEKTGTSEKTYTYDDKGNQLTITGTDGTITREYDDFGRVISKTVPDIGTTEFVYDIKNGVETGYVAELMIDPKGNRTTKVYDKVGRLVKVIDGNVDGTSYTTFEYYDNGSRKSVQYEGGQREEYGYYKNNLLKSLTNKDSSGVSMDVYTYMYDNAGNQIAKYEVINGVTRGTTLYTYDVLNRLEKVVEPGGKITDYTFDMAGNRKTETVTAGSVISISDYTYNEQNRLESVEQTLMGCW